MINKVLRRNFNLIQIITAFLGSLAGIAILMIAIRFYLDVKPGFNEDNGILAPEYVTLNKDVSMINSAKGISNTFSLDEVDDIQSQDFIEDAAPLKTAQFNIYGRFSHEELLPTGFETLLFLESAPDNFLDIESEEWHWNPGDEFVPMVIPSDFVKLYNFGFASGQDLPQVSENALSYVNFTVTAFSENSSYMEYDSRIVGFSDRINSILVPEEFINYHNLELKNINPEDVEINRLLLKVENTGDPEFLEYLTSHAYRVKEDKISAGKAAFFLKLISGIVIVVGLIISALSFWLLISSMQLIMLKNKAEIYRLGLIGHSNKEISKFYTLLNIGMIILLFILALILSHIVRNIYIDKISQVLDIQANYSSIIFFVIFLLILLFISLINTFIIKKQIKNINK